MGRDSVSLSLLDALSETGFQASVIATYCCYFPFYEEVVLRRLLSNGCTNNILMVDATLCAEAFASDDARPRRAGLDYTLVPVQMPRGAFHPKLIVALGKSKGALFVGSHNATLAGFGLNDEVTNEFRIGRAGARQGGDTFRAALDYLQGFVPRGITHVGEVFGRARRILAWLDDPVAVGANERVFLTTRGDDAELWGQIRRLIPKRPTMAFVCGPFFDKNLEFLQRVLNDVRPRRLVVGIDPESVVLDPATVHKLRGARFVNIGGITRLPNERCSGGRYLHAKILWFVASDGELLVTGSANPSRAAFLSDSERRNAEAVVVDLRKGAGNLLALDELVTAPEVEAKDWTRVSERQVERAGDDPDARGAVVLAVPSDNGFVLDQPIDAGMSFDAFASNGGAIGEAVTHVADSLVLEAPEAVRNTAHTLRARDPGERPILVLVHRPGAVDKNVEGNLQRELRRALGALEEDPTKLDMLLKLTEKVIFDSDDGVRPESASLKQKAHTSVEKSPERGPESLAVDAVGRRASRKKKWLASGDILVLLDALMYRLGEEYSTSVGAHRTLEEVRPVTDDDLGDDEPDAPTPLITRSLATVCRSKVGRLIRRMEKQLQAAPFRARPTAPLRNLPPY